MHAKSSPPSSSTSSTESTIRTMNRTIFPKVETAASPTARAVRAPREMPGKRFSRGAFFRGFFASGFFSGSGAGLPLSGFGAPFSGAVLSSPGAGSGTVSPDTGGTGAVSPFGISL